MKLFIARGAIPPPISPSDIDSARHFFNAFGHQETEVSAGWIVSACQRKGDWLPFPLTDLDDRHRAKGFGQFRFNRLIDAGYIHLDAEGMVHISYEFVLKCHESSPARAGQKEE